MRNWKDKLEWSQRSSLVFQTAKCILHVLKQLSIVRLDFCFTVFDRVLKDIRANEQKFLFCPEKPRVLTTTLLCQCCNFSTSGLALASCRAGIIAPSPPPVCLTNSHKSHPISMFSEQAEWILDRKFFSKSSACFIEKQLIWRGFSNTEGLSWCCVIQKLQWLVPAPILKPNGVRIFAIQKCSAVLSEVHPL